MVLVVFASAGANAQSTSAAPPPTAGQMLTPAEACADLQTLRSILEGNAAYLAVNGFDYADSIAAACRSTREPVSVADFAYRVQTVVGRLQDSHSKVAPPARVAFPDRRELPFAVGIHDGKVVALGGEEDGFLVRAHPYLVSINGIPIEQLLAVSGARYRGHSRQRFLARGSDELRAIPSVLHWLGAPPADRLAIVLENADGARATREMPLVERQPRRRPTRPIARMIGDIAYLRIEQMWANDQPGQIVHFDMLRAAIESADFARSRALVIDVRDNDGGERHVLEYLAPFLITGPRVYNVAYPVGDVVGLDDRSLYTSSDPHLSAAQRETASAFQKQFRPSWPPTGAPFLGTAYFAVLEDRPTSHDYSRRPVVILMNERCLSATDIFLGALYGLPNVTLMGVPSSGGSGRARDFTLPRSSVVVTISTMASFRPDGRLYDGYGVEPDVLVSPTLSDVAGQTDSQLDAAIRRLSPER